MTRPASSLRHAAPAPQIGICEADFHVTAPQGPLSSPEMLLQALRREILPVLSEVLESEPLIGLELRIPLLEIDLGHWPDDPRWADLRADFAYKLRLALARYLPSQRDEGPATRAAARGTGHMPVSPGIGQALPDPASLQSGDRPGEMPTPRPRRRYERRRAAALRGACGNCRQTKPTMCSA